VTAPWNNLHRKYQELPPEERTTKTRTPEEKAARKLGQQRVRRAKHSELMGTTQPYVGANGQGVKKPTQYTKELGDEILERVSDGEYDVGIAQDPHMPTIATMRLWREGKNGALTSWESSYARARINQANAMAFEILVLADGADDAILRDRQRALANLHPDASEVEKRRAHFYAKSRSIEATKLAIDARKWITSKLNPAQWSEKVTVDVHAQASTAIQIDFGKLTLEQLEKVAELRALLSANTEERNEPIDITPEPVGISEG
jgi:hypothetical protein